MYARTPVKQITSFTGLRGVAALGVVAYHFREALAGFVPPAVMSALGQGFLAVDLFFILSGFVIYLNYHHMFDEFTLRAAGGFVRARFARIYPVHLFTSLLFLMNPALIVFFSHAKDLGHRYDFGYYLMSLGLVQNWGMTREVEWNIPAWSISTEWFAYLTFPILLLLIGRNVEKSTGALVKIIFSLAVLAAACQLAHLSSLGDDIPQTGLLRCVLEFVAGNGLARIYLAKGAPGTWLSSCLLGLAMCLVAVTLALHLPDFLLIPATFALLIFCLTTARAPLSRVLSWTPLLWLGEISYSLYMIHYFIKDWLKFAIGEHAEPTPWLFLAYVVVAVGAAYILYLFVEKPGRQIFRRRALRKTETPGAH